MRDRGMGMPGIVVELPIGFFLTGSLLFLGVCVVFWGGGRGGAVSDALCIPCSLSWGICGLSGDRRRCRG